MCDFTKLEKKRLLSSSLGYTAFAKNGNLGAVLGRMWCQLLLTKVRSLKRGS